MGVNMKLVDEIYSDIDSTIKYCFKLNGQIVEYTYIDNDSNKDIICVPCQTMCNMGCTFCHLTDHIGKIKLNNMSAEEIKFGVEYIIDQLDLGSRKLLISYMGCGEPMDNINNVVNSMYYLKTDHKHLDIRFGMATMIPKKNVVEFMEFAKKIKNLNIDLKLHLSMHFTNDKLRKEWMPAALGIKESIDLLSFYGNYTGNRTEVHYTIMDKINDYKGVEGEIELLLRNTEAEIKFMRFSEKETLDVKEAKGERIKSIMRYLTEVGFQTEYYEPPGIDVGASCGQFLLKF